MKAFVFFSCRAIYLGIASAISHGYERTRSCSLKKKQFEITKRKERAETAKKTKKTKGGVKRQYQKRKKNRERNMYCVSRHT
jgi:hypothetical protein